LIDTEPGKVIIRTIDIIVFGNETQSVDPRGPFRVQPFKQAIFHEISGEAQKKEVHRQALGTCKYI